MMLYSIVPLEIIFGEYNKDLESTDSIELSYLGEKVEVSPLTNDQYVIRRLISTSPKAFLNPMLQPGSILKKT